MSSQHNTVTTNPSSSKIELSDFLENEPPEVIEAKQLARRYRLPYIDLLPSDQPSPIDYEELAKIPVEMMLRNHFVRSNAKDRIFTPRWPIRRISNAWTNSRMP